MPVIGSVAARRLRATVARIAVLVLVTAGVVSLGAVTPAAAVDRVSVVMTASSNPVASGSQLTYTITVANQPGASIEQVALTDQIAGMTGLILTSNVGTCELSEELVTCDAGSLEGFQSWVVTIRGTVTAANGTTLFNTATATGTQSSQTFTASSTTNTLVGPGSGAVKPDLTVAVSAPVSVGNNSEVTYNLTVGNIGGVKADEITLFNTLPTGFTYVAGSVLSSSLFSCSPSSLTLTCTGGAVNDGATATISFRAKVPDDTSDVGPYKDTAVVDPYDEIAEVNEENNTSSLVNAEPAPPAQKDLTITKTDTPDPLRPGETLTYTLFVKNTATTRADSITVTDGTTGLDASSITATSTPASVGAVCTVAASVVTCTRKSPVMRLDPNETLTITIKGKVTNTAGSLIVNTATVTGNVKNKGVKNTATTTTSVRPGVDLTVVQHSLITHSEPLAPDRFRAFDNFKYVITVGNSGLDTASNVVVREPLPPGMFLKSSSPAAAACVEQPGHIVRCVLPSVAGAIASGQPWGDTETIELIVVSPPTTGAITATVTADPGNAILESDETNNTATTPTLIDTGIDLTVMKSAPANVATNGTLVYTVIVSNIGTQDSTGVVFKDTLPAGTRFRSAEEVFETPLGTPDHRFTCGHDGSATGGTVTCSGGLIRGTHDHQLPVDFATFEITLFAPNAPGSIKNVVRVDPDGAIPEILEDNNVNTFRNNIVVWDPVADPTGATACCAFHELTISKAQVFPAGDVAPSGQLDYDITVKNLGTDVAFGVTVVDHMPAGSVFRSAQDALPAQQGAFSCTQAGDVITCIGGTVDGTVNQVPGDATRTIHVRLFAPTQPGSYTNQTAVDPNNTVPEANETNNSAVFTTKVALGGGGDYIDLKVDSKQTAPLKAGSPDDVVPHGTLQYELDVSNVGTAVAFNVVVQDVIPNGSTFRNAFDKTSGPGAFDCSESGGVVTCTGGTLDGSDNDTPLAGDQTRTIVINLFAPTQPGSYVNQAFVDPVNAIPENSEVNNSDQTILNVKLTGGGNYTDLLIDSITSDKATPQPGEAFKYTVTVKNTGTDVAYDVSLRNILDSGVTYVKTVASNDFFCTESAHVVTCTGGVLDGTPVGQDPTHSDTATIEIFVKAPLVHGYVAPIQSRVDPDGAIAESNEGNNSKTAQVTVTSVIDLKVHVEDTSIGTGTEGDLKFHAINAGTGPADNVTVVFDAAVGIIPLNVLAPSDEWSCQITENPINEVTCTGGPLNAGDDLTFTVHAYKTADETVHSTATIDPANTIVEIDDNNNSDQGTA